MPSYIMPPSHHLSRHHASLLRFYISGSPFSPFVGRRQCFAHQSARRRLSTAGRTEVFISEVLRTSGFARVGPPTAADPMSLFLPLDPLLHPKIVIIFAVISGHVFGPKWTQNGSPNPSNILQMFEPKTNTLNTCCLPLLCSLLDPFKP